MKLYMIRHGETQSNRLMRYLGRTDEGLSPCGEAGVRDAGCFPDVSHVFVSGLCRTQQTARILFPNAVQTVDEGLNEMDFGDFEYRLISDLEKDPDFCAWVDSDCTLPCKNGEDMTGFTKRVSAALLRCLFTARARGEERVIIVSHGGAIMAIMKRYANPAKPFFEWYMKNVTGFSADVSIDEAAGNIKFLAYMPLKHLSF